MTRVTIRTPEGEVEAVDEGYVEGPVYDEQGRLIDDAYAERVVDEVHREIARRAGRPSLTGRPATSPRLQLRVTPELDQAITDAAAAAHMARADWMRQALVRATRPRYEVAAKHEGKRWLAIGTGATGADAIMGRLTEAPTFDALVPRVREAIALKGDLPERSFDVVIRRYRLGRRARRG